MTAKEIYALRKEGRLDEAYAEAKKALETNANDAWIVKALAWVLYDMIKVEMKRGSPNATVLLEEFNALPLGEDDELLIKQKTYLNQQTDPLKIQSNSLSAKSKEGHHEEALNGFRQLRQGNPENHHIDSDYGWAIFRRLYHLSQEQQQAQIIGELLREYSHLTIGKPDLLHSCMLKAAIHQAEHCNKLIEFILWWNLDYLREEDYAAEKDEQGHEYPSLYVKMIRAIGKSLKKRDDLNAETVTKLLPMFEDAIKQCPSEEWFPYYHGQLLIKSGHPEQARKELMPLIKTKQRDFWAWDLLAQLCDDLTDRCACLCKALICRVPDEGFLVNVRVELAECLIKLGMNDEARTEIEHVMRLRAKKGWRISREIQNLAQELHAQAGRAEEQANTTFYKKYETRAIDLLLGDEPLVIGVVTHVNKQKRLSRITFGKERTDFTLVYHDKYPVDFALLEEGAIFGMKMSHDEQHQRHHVLTLTPASMSPDASFYRAVEGTLRKKYDQPFAFLDENILAPPLVSAYRLENGQKIQAHAVREWNEKRNAFTWRVVKINYLLKGTVNAPVAAIR